ncbi:transposase [Hymenobacter elongatus]|uniref:transposase n=1 Tax=Hymenobacter elongatus TaxID=877208 RepID=UPI0014367B4D|nr:transposase [Hymenobacter elongatus]
MCTLVEVAHITLEGLFLNAYSGFAAYSLRDDCFRRGIEANIAYKPRSGQSEEAANQYCDEKLYRHCTAIERTNAWVDRLKTLLVRYETNVDNWLAFHFPAFSVLLLRKIPQRTNPKQAPFIEAV